MKTTLLGLLFCAVSLSLFSQVPQGFNYQAIARDAGGNPIVNATIKVKLSILSDTNTFYSSGGGTYIWEEEHTGVTTNAYGLFTLFFGKTPAVKVQGSAASFSAINWAQSPLYVGIKVANPTAYRNMGTARLLSVPYSMGSAKADLAVNATNATSATNAANAAMADSAKALRKGSKLAVVSSDDATTTALFEVKRKDGQTVFAVYPDAVNVYVPTGAKGNKGGFAIGGFGSAKAPSQDYFRVTPDSVRIYIDNTPPVYTKGASKGGFAIGGFDGAKGSLLPNYYMNITGANAVTTVDSAAQVLWYPNKQAFLAGKVSILSADSVGTNSTALGYKSRAIGNYSQAFGYRATARGDYSTSIGKLSIAGARVAGVSTASNAFALGNATKATGPDSYALGTGAEALGNRAFAFGSVGVDTAGVLTGVPTRASGSYSTAIGMGAQAGSTASTALGVTTSASGPYATAMGYGSISSGNYSVSLGYRANASGAYSAAIGYYAYSTNSGAHSFGYRASAGGYQSLSLGLYATTTSTSGYSAAVGPYARTTANYASAFGRSATANGENSVAVGFGALTNAIDASAFGKSANASGSSSMALGVSASASGVTATAIGNLAVASAQNALAFGNSNTSSGTYAVTLGNSNIAGTLSYAVALGNSNTSSGSYSIAFGNNNISSSSYSTAIGTSVTSSNTYSTAIGYLAEATGSKSLSIGAKYSYTLVPKPIIIIPRFKGGAKGDLQVDEDPKAIPAGIDASGKGIIPIYTMSRNNIADGTYSLAIGNGNNSTNGGASFGVYNQASQLYATAIGFQNFADAPYSIAAGYLNQTTGDFATAFGRSTEAQAENTFVIGRYNVPWGTTTTWVETDPLFQIGNGSSSAETHDAFRVLKNGGTYIYASDATYGLYTYNYAPDRTSSTYGTYTYVNNNSANAGNTYGGYYYAYHQGSGTNYGLRSYSYGSSTSTGPIYSGWFSGGSSGSGTYMGLHADIYAGPNKDLAEYIYDSKGDTEAADVVAADVNTKESVVKSSRPYQTSVVGVITTKPNMVMGEDLVIDQETGKYKPGVKATRLALSGRVPVKVNGENGAIIPGDYLTSSSTPGVAMKWTLLDVNEAKDFNDLKRILSENEKRRNAIIGKAVEGFSGNGTGKVVLLISLQ